MIVSVASGKGGTGKTTIAAALASVWESPLDMMDLDVEAPNLHLFVKADIEDCRVAGLEVPVVDESRCTHCRMCADLCQFKAISDLGRVLLVFPEMCHGCGGCIAVCPENALTPGTRELGDVCWGSAGQNGFFMGRLRIGEAMSPPLMREVKACREKFRQGEDRDLIVDAPPGTSCPAVNAVMDSQVVCLVTEPTPFGLYDLKLAMEAFRPLGPPMGVVINRDGIGDDAVFDFCRKEGIPVLARIPFSRELAEAYSEGRVFTEAAPELIPVFENLAEHLRRLGNANTPATEASHA